MDEPGKETPPTPIEPVFDLDAVREIISVTGVEVDEKHHAEILFDLNRAARFYLIRERGKDEMVSETRFRT